MKLQKNSILLFSIIFFITFLDFLWAEPSEEQLRTSILTTARKYIGVPYIYGSESPYGFDCSGFVRYVYKEATGLEIPHSSKQIWLLGKEVTLSEAKKGDILVFDTTGGSPSHVAILIDDKTIIHAVSSGLKTGVLISPLNDNYFRPRLLGVRSFLSSSQESSQMSSSTTTEVRMDTIGFTITNEPIIYVDKIPALQGSRVQFVITNGTGTDSLFEILFYRMDIEPSNTQTIRQDRILITTKEPLVMEPLIFNEPGQYKLIIKTQSNLKRIERTWKVISLK
jgi:hypothetical protein